MSAVSEPRERAAGGYAPDGEERPLAAYAGLATVFAVGFTSALAGLRAGGRELPERPAAADLVLAGIATHKISRLLAKDKVTSFLRAPFTRFQESAGHGELSEAARGRGARFAVGELLVCPYCLSQWVSAGFAIGLVAAPRTTRLIAGMYAADTLADFLQLAYKAAEDRV